MTNLQHHVVMVAGGAGFVGSAIVRELLARDIRVVCYDSYLHGVPENVEGLTGPLTIVRGDVLNPWKLAQTVKDQGVDFIIDCVGDTFVPTCYEIPQRFFDVNLQGTYNLLMAAKLCGVKRMVYISSTEVYGQHDQCHSFSESAPFEPINTYAVSKLAADRLCFTFNIEHQIPVVIARIFNCYGPRETHPYIIPEIITQLDKGPVLMLGNLLAERDLTYVHDTARALISVLESDIPNGEAVNVGSDTCYSVKWLAHTLAELMGVKSLEIREDPRRLRRLDLDRLRCDNAKLQKWTSWEPQVEIQDGLLRTIDWFRKNGRRWCWEGQQNDVIFSSEEPAVALAATAEPVSIAPNAHPHTPY
jgi:nucleoside-diphosphate-sugar epimerase